MIWLWVNTYRYNFLGTSIYQFFDVHQGYRALTHNHMLWDVRYLLFGDRKYIPKQPQACLMVVGHERQTSWNPKLLFILKSPPSSESTMKEANSSRSQGNKFRSYISPNLPHNHGWLVHIGSISSIPKFFRWSYRVSSRGSSELVG